MRVGSWGGSAEGVEGGPRCIVLAASGQTFHRPSQLSLSSLFSSPLFFCPRAQPPLSPFLLALSPLPSSLLFSLLPRFPLPPIDNYCRPSRFRWSPDSSRWMNRCTATNFSYTPPVPNPVSTNSRRRQREFFVFEKNLRATRGIDDRFPFCPPDTGIICRTGHRFTVKNQFFVETEYYTSLVIFKAAGSFVPVKRYPETLRTNITVERLTKARLSRQRHAYDTPFRRHTYTSAFYRCSRKHTRCVHLDYSQLRSVDQMTRLGERFYCGFIKRRWPIGSCRESRRRKVWRRRTERKRVRLANIVQIKKKMKKRHVDSIKISVTPKGRIGRLFLPAHIF